MNHQKTLRAVVVVTGGYVIVLAVWAGWLRPHSPPGTLPYQLVALIAGFASALGLAMMVANRSTAAQRRLSRNGVEGWATIEFARQIDEASTELHLRFTIPGSESFAGRIVYSIPPNEVSRFETGNIVPIMVDPSDHHRVLLLPAQSLDQE
ncbi:hypothetical protein QMK17_08310 [Rhodococcus sp. G-MC3]|uniref:hypothetical protein n=1 Tax=Rhodococcus sp. G-MC3 TaxID=3046209 RepID=UPI0024B89D3C|nr:hypothetical protein [Rhodococcus sp. G-MC3]MDJ0393334.1 hypothetical protein [Rhodococcus sp. G-MC3]